MSLPALDLDAEDPYPEDGLAAATIDRMMKRHRHVEAAFSGILDLRRQPYDEETGELRSFFDIVFESVTLEHHGKPPATLHFEKRGHFWKDDIEDWSELPQVEIPIDYDPLNLPRVLVENVYSCRYCGYYSHRDDRILSHIREKHPQVEGPLCIAHDEADIIAEKDAENESGITSIPTTLSEFGITDGSGGSP